MGLAIGYLRVPKTDSTHENGFNNSLAYGASIMQGWRTAQEDAFTCILNFEDGCSFFSVYDGHGGSAISNLAKNKLHKVIQDLLREEQDIELALHTGFLSFDASLKDPENLAEFSETESSDDDAAGPFTNPNKRRRILKEQDIDGRGCLHYLLKEELSDTDSDDADYGKEMEVPNSDSEKTSDGSLSYDDISYDDTDDEEIIHKELLPSSSLESEVAGPSGSGTLRSSSASGNSSSTDACCETSSSSAIIEEKKGENSVQINTSTDASSLKDISEKDIESTAPKLSVACCDPIELDICDKKDHDINLNPKEATTRKTDKRKADNAKNYKESHVEDSDSDVVEIDIHEEKDSGLLKVSESGSTATVAIVTKSKIYVANIGDSRCVLSRNGIAFDLSVDHKPDDPEEYARIKNAGCTVTDGRINECLNLSRAFGDFRFKKSNIPNEQCVTAEPFVNSINIEKNDEFLVIASDGIWNSMSSQEVIDFIIMRFKCGDCNLNDICEEMFKLIIAPHTWNDGTGCDNMTLIIIKLNTDGSEVIQDSNESQVAISRKDGINVSPSSPNASCDVSVISTSCDVK